MNLRTTATLAVVAFFLLSVAGVLLRPLFPVDETRYVDVAWEMWLNGNYLVPTRNFDLYTDKPPLLFWSINLVWSVFGVSEIAARLVAPLYALAGVVLVGVLASRLWPDDAGAGPRTQIALSGLLAFAFSANLTMFDAMLATATVAGMLALVAAGRTGATRWWVALGAALAMGVLTKGPVIVLHLVPAALLLPVWADARWQATWKKALFGTGIAVLSAVLFITPWLGPALVLGGPEYREAVLWTQSAGRISSSFAHKEPWWFYIALLPFLAFPWIFVPAIWKGARKAAIWSEPGLRLALIWVAAALIIFSLISGKQAHYLVPELPAVALIVGRLTRGLGDFRLTWAVVPVALIALFGAAAAVGLVPLGRAELLLQPRVMIFVWAVLIGSVAWGALRLGGLRGGVVLALGVVLSVNLLIGLTDMRDIYDARRIAQAVKPDEDSGIAFIGQSYHAEFNFAGRLTQPVATPVGQEAIDAWIADHPTGVIIGRPDRANLPWKPAETIPYRGANYALWRVVQAPQKDIAS